VRRGFFGGSFDPPHVGHLMVASDAHEALGLDRLTFIPNAQQPLKAGSAVTDPETRLEMLRGAVDGDPRFDVDPCEVVRGGTSYTVDTLTELSRRYPGDSLFFCVGADVGLTFAHWREPARILELAQLAILRRSGDDGGEDDASLLAPFRRVVSGSGQLPVLVRTRRVDVSSTEVRSRVRAGRPLTGFVPEAVARFIGERGLYHTALP
jgi:nicotinate-nucleotide adenylyltransferase